MASEHTLAPWPEFDEHPDYHNAEHNPSYEWVEFDRADYAHARDCVNFVARLEAAISWSNEQTMLFRLGDNGRWVIDYHTEDESNVVQFADTLTDLLGGDDAD